jgi:hypothetical protein
MVSTGHPGGWLSGQSNSFLGGALQLESVYQTPHQRLVALPDLLGRHAHLVGNAPYRYSLGEQESAERLAQMKRRETLEAAGSFGRPEDPLAPRVPLVASHRAPRSGGNTSASFRAVSEASRQCARSSARGSRRCTRRVRCLTPLTVAPPTRRERFPMSAQRSVRSSLGRSPA